MVLSLHGKSPPEQSSNPIALLSKTLLCVDNVARCALYENNIENGLTLLGVYATEHLMIH